MNQTSTKTAVLGFVVSAITWLSLTAGAWADALPELADEVTEYLEAGGTITNVWHVNEHLVGITLEVEPGSGMTVFADASGRYLLSGAMIDLERGVNLAEEATRRQFPAPSPRQMFEEAKEKHWVATSRGRRAEEREPIYVIADTQCGYCHEVAKAIARHNVRREVRWILVGYLGPKSTNQAAALLDMPEQGAGRALWAILTGQADGSPPDPTPETVKRVTENNQWAETWGVQGTPVTLIPHEGTIHRVVGLPRASMWEIIAP